MKKIRVNANAIVDDIRMGLDLKSLMEKHGLSYRNLLKVLGRLQEKGWITRGDLGHLNLAEGSEQSTVPAKEFLVSFRSRPDDFHLMDTFRLTPKALRKMYEKLIQAGLLSEYEYHCRDRKAPELEEHFVNNVSEASTEVTLLKSDGGWGVWGDDETTGRAVLCTNDIHVDNPRGSVLPGRRSGVSTTSVGTEPKETTPEICPRCGCPSHPSSPDACPRCGVVFSKLERVPSDKRIPIWQLDYGIR